MGNIIIQPVGGANIGCSELCTATKSQVLKNKTAITSDSEDSPVAGTMPDNTGSTAVTKVGSDGTDKNYVIVPYGYYDSNSTGTANSHYFYMTNNQAKDIANAAGVGYNKGVSDADGRTNTNSTNYKNGYNAGYSNGMSTTYNSGNIGSGASIRSTTIANPGSYILYVHCSGTLGDEKVNISSGSVTLLNSDGGDNNSNQVRLYRVVVTAANATISGSFKDWGHGVSAVLYK